MKKILFSVLFVMFACVTSAQGQSRGQGMGEADMQNLMQMMQKMQECMAKVDQQELERLGAEADTMEAELKELCAEGKRDKAQKTAIAYSKKIMNNPALKQMQECGEMTKGLIPQEEQEPSLAEEFDFSNRHVCDDME